MKKDLDTPQSDNALVLHQKYIEIIGSIIYEQNRQLLIEIANTYGLDLHEIQKEFLVSKQQFFDLLAID